MLDRDVPETELDLSGEIDDRLLCKKQDKNEN